MTEALTAKKDRYIKGQVIDFFLYKKYMYMTSYWKEKLQTYSHMYL